ncbi:MAG: phosphatase PAP2 family protein [Acidobacteria bacterium]|nr:phosphatase PAP2 family protein [Acidobacteriota bacterium]
MHPLFRRLLATVLVAALGPAAASAQSAADPSPARPAPAVTPGDVCSEDGLSTVFRCVFHDIGQIGGHASLLWLAAGGTVAGGSLLLDDEVLKLMRDPDQDTSVAAGENLGEAGLHFGVPAALYVIARTTGHPKLAALSITLVRTQVVNGFLTRSLKLLPRPRPYQEKATPTKGSFPSGHTSAAFASATVLTRRWGWRAGVPAYTVATFVGVTRLQNIHYLSDVTFGAALGIASGLAVHTNILSSRHASIEPIVGRGKTGVALSIAY